MRAVVESELAACTLAMGRGLEPHLQAGAFAMVASEVVVMLVGAAAAAVAGVAAALTAVVAAAAMTLIVVVAAARVSIVEGMAVLFVSSSLSVE